MSKHGNKFSFRLEKFNKNKLISVEFEVMLTYGRDQIWSKFTFFY